MRARERSRNLFGSFRNVAFSLALVYVQSSAYANQESETFGLAFNAYQHMPSTQFKIVGRARNQRLPMPDYSATAVKDGGWPQHGSTLTCTYFQKGEKIRSEWTDPTPVKEMVQRKVQTYDGKEMRSQQQYVTGKKWVPQNTRGLFEEARGWISLPAITAYNPLYRMGRNQPSIVIKSVINTTSATFGKIKRVVAESDGSEIVVDFAGDFGGMCVYLLTANSKVKNEFKVVEIGKNQQTWFPSHAVETTTFNEESFELDWTLTLLPVGVLHDSMFSIDFEEDSTVQDPDTSKVYLVKNGKLIPHPMFSESLFGTVFWPRVACLLLSFAVLFLSFRYFLTMLRSQIRGQIGQ